MLNGTGLSVTNGWFLYTSTTGGKAKGSAAKGANTALGYWVEDVANNAAGTALLTGPF